MASELEMIESDIREVQAHLAVWPNDGYATMILRRLYDRLEGVATPSMSHQRERVDLGQPLPAVPPKIPTASECRDVLKDLSKAPQAYHQVFKDKDALRYTFGEDHEMDQRWLDAERGKVSGHREDQMSIMEVFYGEMDNMMFPTLAYNLTSMHNLNYGTSRY